MIDLTDVTLVAIDCVAHELTRMALQDSLREICPAEILTFSDEVLIPEARHFSCAPDSFDRTLWYEVPKELKTSHFLVIQWDGWVLDGKRWNPEWLRYDYIGASWPWHRKHNVGNGGFSLRSTRLAHYLVEHSDEFPVSSPEDHALCRNYIERLSSLGFRWAPKFEADVFSFERAFHHPTFGFHGVFNWPHFMSQVLLQGRLPFVNDYVRSKVEWNEIMKWVA